MGGMSRLQRLVGWRYTLFRILFIPAAFPIFTMPPVVKNRFMRS
jgi:hypothetical protein